MLFGKLPDDIFRPLSGSNRFIFEKVLKHLYGVFFDDDHPDHDAPLRSVVIQEIHSVLLMEESINLVDEEGNSILDTPATAANYLYQRLIKTGWLDTESEGFKTYVIPNQSASMLLEALIDIEHREKKSYGRVVLSILTHIEATIQDPRRNGLVFLEAVAQTREFSNHLRGILYSLKEVQDYLAGMDDPKEALKEFFTLFVDGILIADYQTLNSTDNPFRFRSQILGLLTEIEYDKALFNEISRQYREYFVLSEEDSVLRLKRDLAYIAREFHAVDKRLARIDLFCRRLQNRMKETVRFMDRSMPGISNRLAAMITSIEKSIPNGYEPIVPAPSRMNFIANASAFSLRNLPRKREKPSVQVLRQNRLTDEEMEKKRVIREYLKKREMEPMRVIKYLEKQMAVRLVMSAAEFSIESVEDLICFLLIRQLPRMQRKMRVESKLFNITTNPDSVETEWIICPDFTVERVSHAK